MSAAPTRSQMLAALMEHQSKAVDAAIAEGEDPGCFDLSGARMWYEELSFEDLTEQFFELNS